MPHFINQHELPPVEHKIDHALSATQFEVLSAQIEENKRLLEQLLVKLDATHCLDVGDCKVGDIHQEEHHRRHAKD